MPSCQSAAAPSCISSTSSAQSLQLLPFGFAERTNFDARQELQQTRSKHFKLAPKDVDDDVWKRPPPDFRPQAWAPRPPKRNSRESMQPWRFSSDSDVRFEMAKANAQHHVVLPVIMRSQQQQQQQQQRPRMQTVFRVVRPDTARRQFVQQGTNERQPYEMPAPHDFRGYPPIKSLGLPEFTTAADKDPYNVRFLTENKDIIIGPLHETKNMRDASGTLWSAVQQPPKWDPKLHLGEGKFPCRSGEYSRYRPRNRDPFVAFMDSVEERLEDRWLMEKAEKPQPAAGAASAAAARAAARPRASAA